MGVFIYLFFFGMYFSSNYRKVGFNSSTFLIGIYFISSIFAFILLFVYDTYDLDQVTFIRTIFHSVVIYLFLSPIVTFGNRVENKLTIPNGIGLDIFTYIVIMFTILSIIYSIPRVSFAFSFDDLRSVRNLHNDRALYEGPAAAENPFMYIGSIGHHFAILSLFLFFFYLAYKPKSRRFQIILFLGSFSIVLNNLSMMGRDGIVRWILLFVFFFLFFKKKLPPVVVRRTLYWATVASVPIIIVFLLISFSRFSERENSVLYYLIDYAGQSFIYFSYNFESFYEGAFGGRMSFPILFSREEQVKGALNDTIYSSYNLNTFSTFVGSFYKDVGLIVTLLIGIFFRIIMSYYFNYTRNSFVKLIVYILLFQVILFGVFYYMFYNITVVRTLLLVVFISLILSNNFFYRVKRVKF